jgi:NAD+ synthase (glutamine-hydrolysing)
MRLVKVGLGSISTTVGAVRSNVDRMLQVARAMAADGVTVGNFPEQAVGGYPPEDLVQWRPFVAAQREELLRFAAATSDLDTVFVAGVAVGVGGQLFNCAAVVHGGDVLGYNVFYEGRNFSRGSAGLSLDAAGIPLGDHLFGFDFGVLAVEVCEDVWSPDGPLRRRAYSGAELVLNVTSSPFRLGVVQTRREMLATRSADSQVALAYVNGVGAQDGLIFDGGGYVCQNGRVLLEAPRFREGFATCVVDLDRTLRLRQENTTWRSDCEAFLRDSRPVPAIASRRSGADRSALRYPLAPGDGLFLPAAPLSGSAPPRTARDEALDDLFSALSLGVKDYFVKTGAFTSFGIALSGGRDSMLTLLIAWRAAQLVHGLDGLDGAGGELWRKVGETITAFYMPSRFSEEGTRGAAAKLAAELHVPLRTVPIDDAFDREVEAVSRMLAGGAEPTPVTLQNVQARLRAARMWSWANTAGALFLQTGDMSEKAVGYTTIGGDLEGGLSVIANLPKSVVVALLDRLHRRFGFAGIAATLATTPGPELAHRQTAEDELMPFPVLDACLHLYAGEKLSPAEVAGVLPGLFPDLDPDQLGVWAERFAVLATRSIYKWVQSPLALHVGSLDLDRERALQLPVVQRSEWAVPVGERAATLRPALDPKGGS